MSERPNDQPKDVRLEATKTIGAFSVAMLGISIPLCAITRDPIIAVLILVGSTLSTIAVWAFGGRQSHAPTPPIPKPLTPEQEHIKALEERLANLEVMDSYERQAARERKLNEEPQTFAYPQTAEARSGSDSSRQSSLRARPITQ